MESPEGPSLSERDASMNAPSTLRTIRSVAKAVAFAASGLLVAFVLKVVLHVPLSKVEVSAIAFVVTTLCVLLLYPRLMKEPFGKVTVGDFVRRVGLAKPGKPVRFVLLGVLAAAFTLSGMLIGSMLTGKFVFSTAEITWGQAAFSLTPGIWEEVMFRGVVMLILLKHTGSFRKAAIIQIAVFGVAHIKGLDILSLVDAFSVGLLAIAFTYIAYKTRSLLPGIVFHYLHDTFLFFVQLPGGEFSGFRDNALFFSALWIAILVTVVCVKVVAERLSIVSEYDFYGLQDGSRATRQPVTPPVTSR